MQVYGTETIRDVAFLSHSGAGKTALAEAMLFASGAINRLGKVEDGNTTTDFEPEEIDRHHSVQLALAPCEWAGTKVNLIDTPGYADFAGDVRSALAAADCAVIVISAVDGIEVGTEATWRAAEQAGLPRFIIINKMDRDNADFFQNLDAVHQAFGRKCVPLNLPDGEQSEFKGVIDLRDPAQAGNHPRFSEFREQLVEAAAEAEDALTEKYLEEGDLSADDVARGLHAGVVSGSICPVLSASATHQLGVKEILDAMVKLAPSPLERSAGEGSAEESGPAVALVFKTTADPYVGKVSYLRVLRGSIASDSHVWNATKGEDERLGQIFLPRGKGQENVASLSAGDIGAVAKLQHTATGDAFGPKGGAVDLPPIEFPAPVYSVSISPKTKADMDKMGTSIARLVEEDPSLRVTRDQGTGETVLSGLGDAHIDVAVKRLKRKFGVEVVLSTPRVPYRETIKVKTRADFKHKKQTGGHGQYGHVILELEPQPRGSGVTFETRVVGGSVPREYFPAVEKGVMEAVHSGVVSGNQVVDVKVTLCDGSSHPVDSSGMAFQIAASQALRKGLQQGQPALLEPILLLKVTVPDANTGDVMGDLNGKRGKVLGMNPQDGLTTIEAQAPLSELQRYATELRSLTQGRGSYTTEFDHYDELPAHLLEKVAEETRQAAGV